MRLTPRLLVALGALALAAPLAQGQPRPAEAPAPARAAAPGPMLLESSDGVALLTSAREALYGYRLAEARRAFTRLGRLEPSSPAGAHGLATAAFWEALLTEAPAAYDRAYALNDSLRSLAGALPDSPWKRHVEAEGHLYRAVLLARQERYARAGAAFRDACSRFRTNTRGAEPFAESFLGLGTCQVAAGAVPRQYRWVARLAGFTGTVPEGLATVRQAAETATYTRVEAAFGLAFVDAALNDRRGGALALAAPVAEAHAESPLAGFAYGHLLLSNRRAADAEAVLRRAQAAAARPGVAPLPHVDYWLGLALHRQNKFAEAAPLFEGYTRAYRGQAMVPTAYLMAGLARELAGDRRAAEAHYRRVRSARDYDADRSAVREAERRLREPVTPRERTLLVGANAFDAGSYAEAIRTLQPVLADAAAEPAQRAEAAYRSGRAFHAQADYAEALRHYELAVSRPGDPRARWGPWSFYHTGEVHEALGNTAEARRIYRQALANEAEFDFSKALEGRARASLDRL